MQHLCTYSMLLAAYRRLSIGEIPSLHVYITVLQSVRLYSVFRRCIDLQVNKYTPPIVNSDC